MAKGIYLIQLDDINWVYIGQTNGLEGREEDHRRQLKNKEHHCKALQEAYNNMIDNGYKEFTFKWLYTAEENENLKYLEHIFAIFYKTIMKKKLYNTQACNKPDMLMTTTPLQFLELVLQKAFAEDAGQAYAKVTSFIGNLLIPEATETIVATQTAATVQPVQATVQPQSVQPIQQPLLQVQVQTTGTLTFDDLLILEKQKLARIMTTPKGKQGLYHVVNTIVTETDKNHKLLSDILNDLAIERLILPGNTKTRADHYSDVSDRWRTHSTQKMFPCIFVEYNDFKRKANIAVDILQKQGITLPRRILKKVI